MKYRQPSLRVRTKKNDYFGEHNTISVPTQYRGVFKQDNTTITFGDIWELRKLLLTALSTI